MSTDTLSLGPSFWTPGKIINDTGSISQTGAAQFSAKTGNRWKFVLVYQNLVGTRRKTMEAHDRQLQGRINRLQVNMSTLGWVRTGAGGGTPLLVGAHVAGVKTLSIDGASAGITNWLTGADYITIGNELKAVTAPCNTNGSGATSISIWPEVHQNRADNAVVNIATPFGVFFQGDIAQYGSITPYVTSDYLLESLTFTLEEDLLA